jgi:hypothetical protein
MRAREGGPTQDVSYALNRGILNDLRRVAKELRVSETSIIECALRELFIAFTHEDLAAAIRAASPAPVRTDDRTTTLRLVDGGRK